MIKQYNITDYIKDDPELQKAVIEEFLNDIARLEEENERLKENLEDLIKDLKVQNEIIGKFEKALEEIREIAENYFEECGVPDDYFKRNNYSWKQHQIKGLTCKLQQILDKINEVLKEGEGVLLLPKRASNLLKD